MSRTRDSSVAVANTGNTTSEATLRLSIGVPIHTIVPRRPRLKESHRDPSPDPASRPRLPRPRRGPVRGSRERDTREEVRLQRLPHRSSGGRRHGDTERLHTRGGRFVLGRDRHQSVGHRQDRLLDQQRLAGDPGCEHRQRDGHADHVDGHLDRPNEPGHLHVSGVGCQGIPRPGTLDDVQHHGAAHFDADADTDADRHANSNADAHSNANADSDANGHSDPDRHADPDADCDADDHADANADHDADGNAHGDADCDAYADRHTYSDAYADRNADAYADSGAHGFRGTGHGRAGDPGDGDRRRRVVQLRAVR